MCRGHSFRHLWLVTYYSALVHREVIGAAEMTAPIARAVINLDQFNTFQARLGSVYTKPPLVVVDPFTK